MIWLSAGDNQGKIRVLMRGVGEDTWRQGKWLPRRNAALHFFDQPHFKLTLGLALISTCKLAWSRQVPQTAQGWALVSLDEANSVFSTCSVALQEAPIGCWMFSSAAQNSTQKLNSGPSGVKNFVSAWAVGKLHRPCQKCSWNITRCVFWVAAVTLTDILSQSLCKYSMANVCSSWSHLWTGMTSSG